MELQYGFKKGHYTQTCTAVLKEASLTYIDRLLIQLAHAGVGCYISPHFVGALAYADDIVLVAPFGFTQTVLYF